MKQIQKIAKKSYRRHNLLATSIAAVCTAMVATSVTQASDVDIYQEAKSGEITLMFMLDVSGSMSRIYGDSAGYACDLPSGVSEKSKNTATEAPITGGPSYSRTWCTADVTTRFYYYKRTGGSSARKYWECRDADGNLGTVSKNDCVTSRTSAPPSGYSDDGGSNPRYYYTDVTKNNVKFYDRITRLKDGMMDLLYGNAAKGIVKISDDKVIGLSTLGALTGGSNYANTGAVVVPARRLDATVGGQTQRQILIDKIAAFQGLSNTPTARAYAEVAAYLFGTTTGGTARGIIGRAPLSNSGRFYPCTNMTSTGSCSSYSSSYTAVPSYDAYGYDSNYYYYYKNNIANSSASGFPYSSDETKNAAKTLYSQPNSLVQTDDIKKCSGQGVYVLTDGQPNEGSNAQTLMQTALNNTLYSCTDGDDAWDCTHKFVTELLDPAKNPAKLKIKTAVVGFGNGFNNLNSFDRTKTQQQNIDALGTVDSHVKKAAYWGIIGEGGWYSGNSSQDIVNSVNAFLGDLNTEIPSVTTGSPTIPKDALNPAVLQDDAYYQQFQPTPDKNYQLWVGNLKKYLVGENGKLEGRNGASVTDNRSRLIVPTYDANGKLLTATYDFWSTAVDTNASIADADENTFGSRKFAAKGGVWSQLKLRTTADGTLQRKLLTNRVGSGTGASATFTDGTSLRRVNLTDLTDATYQNDPDRGYLMRLLGYEVDAANPATIDTTSLSAAAEFRQVGSVMHSLPVLVTNKGKVTYNASTKKIESTNREDYVLFGTTQGLLHVVDAKSGEEKFAFVPNEMIENQKEAFIKHTATSGGVNNLYYGIDGPWALYTEYVIDGSGNLTVGSGKGTNQKGKQLAFGGLRMGGNSYYSLDLQDINSPKLNFQITPTGSCSNTNPLGCMGQSWSKPSLGYVNWGGKRKLVMFVGGGYDTGYESDSYDQTNKKGAGVYMFSAEGTDAGTLLWWSSANASTSTNTTLPIGTNNTDLKYSVVSEIRTVDRNGDDLIDHLYFGDLGGQLFRIDLDNKAAALTGFAKTPVRLLNLHESSGKSPRFYDMPGFSVYSENSETFAVVSIGTGNRSKPLANYTTGTPNTNNDAIYNIYDKDVASKNLFTAGSSNTQNVTRATLGKLTESNRYSNTTLVAPYGSKDGWYYEFDNCVAGIDGTKKDCDKYKLQSEKVFGTPLAMNYKLYVSTFDSSKPGLSGDCGAGVKGESLLSSFCLPYGQCKSALATDGGSRGTPIGIGIHAVTVGNCTGANCDGGSDGGDDGTGGGKADKKIASASNYCAATGGRMAITVTGGVGKGEATQMCLIPQRWYERVSLK